MRFEHRVHWLSTPDWVRAVGFEADGTMWYFGVNPKKARTEGAYWWAPNGNKCRNYQTVDFVAHTRPQEPIVDLVEQDIVWEDLPSWIQRIVYRSDVPRPRLAAYGRRTYTQEPAWYTWPSLRPLNHGPAPDTFPNMKVLRRPAPGLQSREEFARERAEQNGEEQPHVSALDIAKAVYPEKESPYDELATEMDAKLRLYHYEIRNVDNGLTMQVECPAGYYDLIAVLFTAIEQATVGKGRDRHARDLPFTEQPMQLLNDALDSADGALFQAMKKITESKGLDYEAKLKELRGAIVYVAGAMIWYQRHQK